MGDKENKMELAKGFVEVSLDNLVECDWNYKKISVDESDPYYDREEHLMNALEENFKRNGQIENIIIRKLETGFYEVVNGNHRLKVAKRLGWNTLMCYNLGEVSQAYAMRVAIETNETKFKSDELKLAERLREVEAEFGFDDMLDTMPYTDDELDKFDKLLNFDWDDLQDQEDKKTPDQGDNSPTDDDFRVLRYDLPKAVADQFEYQLDRFKKILYPDTPPKDTSYIIPIEAMLQTIAQVPDDQILGEKKNG